VCGWRRAVAVPPGIQHSCCSCLCCILREWHLWKEVLQHPEDGGGTEDLSRWA
jgi:hypothetical protein